MTNTETDELGMNDIEDGLYGVDVSDIGGNWFGCGLGNSAGIAIGGEDWATVIDPANAAKIAKCLAEYSAYYGHPISLPKTGGATMPERDCKVCTAGMVGYSDGEKICNCCKEMIAEAAIVHWPKNDKVRGDILALFVGETQ